MQIIGAYSTRARDVEKRVQEYRQRFAQDMPEIRAYAIFYGVGNHGGGPTIASIETIRQASQRKYPGMKFADLDSYVDHIRSKNISLNTVTGELQHHARGCYSACANVKLWNRQAEVALLAQSAQVLGHNVRQLVHITHPLTL